MRGDGERDHDLDLRIATGLLALHRGLDDRPRLHAVETRLQDAEPAPAGAEHRVRFLPPLQRGHEPIRLGIAHAVDERVDLPAEHLRVSGQELVQRRVEQAGS